MSVLIDRTSRFAVIGIAGNYGRFCVRDMRAYGTAVVAGVAHGRTEREVEGVPVFADMRAAVEQAGANAAIAFVPATLALDAVLEALESGIGTMLYPGDGLPVRDAIEMRAAARANGVRLVGPNSPGVISPGKAKAGFMPSFCYTPGALGVVSRSGSLSYESSFRLTRAGLGQSTVIGIGGDPVKGLTAGEALELLHADAETRAVVYLGEIGGADEAQVAAYARRADAKPVAGLIVGAAAPPGRKMGHAAALIGSVADTHAAKVALLAAAGVEVAAGLHELPARAQAALARAASAQS